MNREFGYLRMIEHNEEIRRQISANRLERRLRGCREHRPRSLGAPLSAASPKKGTGMRSLARWSGLEKGMGHDRRED